MAGGRVPGSIGVQPLQIDNGTLALTSSDTPGIVGDVHATSSQELEGLKNEVVWDIAQLILDITGIFDPTPVSDGSSALISLARGRWFDAMISAVSIVPYVGDLAKTAKLPRYLESVRKAVKIAHSDPQWALTLRELFLKLKKTLDEIYSGGADKLPDSASKYLKQLKEEIDEFLTREKTAPQAKSRSLSIREAQNRNSLPQARYTTSKSHTKSTSVNSPDTPSPGGKLISDHDKETSPQNPVSSNQPTKVSGVSTGIPNTTPKTPRDAPESITLSSQTNTEFNELWDKSFPNGTSQEHGGTLVRGKDNNINLINKGGGTSGSFSPNRNVGEEQEIVGVFHTHPYDKTEGGYTNVSLSGGDGAYMINTGDSVMIAQSGNGQFMYLRTEQTPKTIDHNKLNTDQNNRVYEIMKNDGKSFDEASRIAASETAKNNGLAYYEGTDGTFNRVYP